MAGFEIERSFGQQGIVAGGDSILADMLDVPEGGACLEQGAEISLMQRAGLSRSGGQICRACDVRTECLENTLASDMRFGAGLPKGA